MALQRITRGLTPALEIESFAKSPLIHPPGTFWEYSLSTDMLRRVIEAVYGKCLSYPMEECLFNLPLYVNEFEIRYNNSTNPNIFGAAIRACCNSCAGFGGGAITRAKTQSHRRQ